jgi:hypothetical protein
MGVGWWNIRHSSSAVVALLIVGLYPSVGTRVVCGASRPALVIGRLFRSLALVVVGFLNFVSYWASDSISVWPALS